MKKIIVLSALFAATFALVPAAFAQDTIDQVKASIVKQWDALKSVSGKFGGSAGVKLNPDMPSPLQLQAGGVTDYEKIDGVIKYRLNAWAGMNEAAPLVSIYSVCDGKEVHVDTLVPFGKRESSTSPIEQAFSFGGQRFFDEISKTMNLSVLPAEKVGDKDCHVIQAVAKEPDPDFPISKLKMYFAREIGVILKVVLIDASNAEMGALTMTDLKVNQPVPEEVFKYTPAPGVVPPAAPAPAAPATAAN